MDESTAPHGSPDVPRMSNDGVVGVVNDQAKPVPQDMSPPRAVLIVLTVTMAMIVNVGNSTSVSISMPTMAKEWGLEERDLQWPVAAYPLSSGCLLLTFGRVADLYGRKSTFVCGSIFLAVFTLACGFANDVIALSVLRAFQGIGSAATIPAALGTLAHEFGPGRSRSFAFATFAAGAPIGAIFGTAVGGALTEFTAKTWRSAFWLMSGMCILSATGGIISISPDVLQNRPADKRIDWVGSFLVTSGLVLIVFVLSQGERAPQKWATPYIIALLILGVGLISLFLVRIYHLERTSDNLERTGSSRLPPPIMKLSLWKRAQGRYAAMMFIAFVNWCSFLSWIFWTQLYYQSYLQLTAMQTVARLVPMAVSGILCNVLVGVAAAHIPLVYLTVGTGATGCASLLLALIDPRKTYWAYGFPAAVISVVGADFVFAAGTLYVAKVSHPQEQSVSGAIFNTMTQLGTAVGITVSTVVFHHVADGLRAKGEDILWAYKAANWTAFGFGMFGVALSIIFFRNVGVVGDRNDTPQPTSRDGAASDKKAEKHV